MIGSAATTKSAARTDRYCDHTKAVSSEGYNWLERLAPFGRG